MALAIPSCKNPNHPHGVDRHKGMIVLEEQVEHGRTVRVVFACVPCRDLEKVLSVQVKTLPAGWDQARYANEMKGIAKAQSIERTKAGRIRYFH